MQRPAHFLRASSTGASPWGTGASALRELGGQYQLQYRWPGSCLGPQPHRWWWARTVAASAAAAELGDAGTAADLSVDSAADLDDEPPLQRRRRVEAVLLFHRGPINLRRLAALASLADATEARTRIRELNELYDQTGSALRIEEVAGGHQLLTRPALAPWLRRMSHVSPPVQLGSAAMETLTIIAYRQPVLRADIEAIRGVACGELVRQLMQKDLVRICGRSEELGRPYLYGTTAYFLQVFGLKNAGALPAVAGASIQDDSEDTLANSEDQSEAVPPASPIETPDKVDLPPSATSPFDAVTPKESDVSIAPGPVVNDEATNLVTLPAALASRSGFGASAPVAIDDDDDDYYDDTDDEDDEDVWEDDEDEDADDDDEELDDEWEEVGDEDEVEVDDAEEEDADADIDEEEDEDEDEEDSDDLLTDDEEDEEWDDEDDDWEEDDEDEEWD